MEKLTLKIKYLKEGMEPLRYIDGKSDWIDLRCAEDVELSAGEFHFTIPVLMTAILYAGGLL